MDKKIIFLDIDGTIMTFQGKLPESAKQALMLAKEAGHSLVLCSGRTKSEIYPELLEMAQAKRSSCAAHQRAVLPSRE